MEYRTRKLNGHPPSDGDCVVYWMQQAQRANWNHALELALLEASRRRIPAYVFFCLTRSYSGSGLRQYSFMLQGLRETASRLRSRGIGFIVRIADPAEGVIELARELNALILVTDCGHTRMQRLWRKRVAESLDIPVLEVETDMVVPVWTASDKEETAAWTLRRKLAPHLEWFLKPVEERDPAVDTSIHSFQTLDTRDTGGILSTLDLDETVKPSGTFKGGAAEARRLWMSFLENRLGNYGRDARNPGVQGTSLMSPYLHFGQVSPVRLAIEAGQREGASEFLEQLVTRRELAVNFAWYNRNYDGYGSIPDWARQTLEKHSSDRREAIYDIEQLERAETHDEYWNAAQRELTETGHMHGYMRMYWGKKVIQWTENPAQAHSCLISMNDRYQLDGRDPNGYAGIAWCFGKHDRPFGTFPVTGNIRKLGSSLEKMRKNRSSRYNGYLRRISSAY